MSVPQKVDPEKNCDACGTPLVRTRFKSGRLEDRNVFLKRRHCSQSCANSREVVQANTHRWRARQVKPRIACEECGTMDIELHVHHIDRDVTNNEPENLMVLCASCHLHGGAVAAVRDEWCRMTTATLTEADFQTRVTDLCDWLNLWWHHTPDSRRSNAGMPDLLIVNLDTGALLFAELKTQKGKVSAKQTKVLFALDRGGNEAVVWRPADWDQIAERLRRLADGR